ncbi:ATP-binding cassette domain-containing protein [Clostridium aestuarii]|uniref:ATP-binding cassette domain-containing protein n=1 Tax=Clostridium aestuarii TaxID=338193 RepID=A0ABT4CVB9_9CLOT|nr:ATP-binding cassette domain-containing protein [Clostridium aestuarii]MCY6482921.1 ATP-binding cassette domain-containing protein [Clostridium aestuarii]
MNDIIKVKGLVKDYGNSLAVDNISFKVKEGEIFGFLGPNGAGKSTTINILCTIIGRTSGEVYINGLDVYKEQDEVRKNIGIIFQEKTLDEKLTARENLIIHGRLYNVPEKEINLRIDEVLEIVELKDRKKDIVSSFSGGMKRRLEIARGLMHYPKVLFLDEPTTGLDPQTRVHMWEYLLKLKEEHNMTIFLTTHYMDEAEICDNIAVIDNGKIVAYGTPMKLKEDLASNIVRFKASNIAEAKKFINKHYDYSTKLYSGNIVEVTTTNSTTPFVVDFIKNYKGEIDHLEINRPTLNDVFMNITGKDIRE